VSEISEDLYRAIITKNVETEEILVMSAIAPDISTSLIGADFCKAMDTPTSQTALPTIPKSESLIPTSHPAAGLLPGMLRSVHHIALNVKDMQAACQFYGVVLGLHKLTGDEVPTTLIQLVAEGKVTNFKTPDGTILDLFWTPNLNPPHPDPKQGFTRAEHLAFDIAADQFDAAMDLLNQAGITFSGPIIRPTGRGIYFYDPDGFMVEVRCNPA
jgi:glyoxylase I family protein